MKIRKSGFTLIELMAVVAILAILAAVLVPTVQGYINRSKKATIIIQARNFVNAGTTYNLATKQNMEENEDGNYEWNQIDFTGSYNTATVNHAMIQFLNKDKLIEVKDVDKIINVPCYIVYDINHDKEAVNNILLNNDGSLKSYTGNESSWLESTE
ncbi:MAG: type II secretion system protein [Clostridium sp.]